MTSTTRTESTAIFGAYGEAKVAVVLYAKELAERLKGTGVTTASIPPGMGALQLWQWWELPDEGTDVPCPSTHQGYVQQQLGIGADIASRTLVG